MTDLPNGWAWTSVGELGRWSGGSTPSKSNSEYWAAGTIPWISPKDMKSDHLERATDHVTPEALERTSLTALPPESVAVVVRSGILERTVPVARLPFEATLNQDLKAVVPASGVASRWVLYTLKAMEDDILKRCRKAGTTVASLESSALFGMPVPMPPTAEQQRIVAAIEEAFSLLDAAETALLNTRTRLKRIRDSVLTAAVTGQLVPQDSTETPAGGLLEAAGRGPEYKSARPLPDGWAPAQLASLLAETIGGVWGSDPGADEVDVRVIRVTEMLPDGTLDPSTAALRSITRNQLRSRELRVGDLLLEKSGGGPTRPVGRVGMVRRLAESSVCANFMQLLRADERVLTPAYLEVLLRAFHAAGGTAALQTATTNIRNLKMKDYFAQVHAVPPLHEQTRIVAEVERQSSFIEAAKRAVEEALARSAGLRRSVLKDAFEGRLVQQDPSDEPASVLLERIRAERAAAPQRTRSRRSTVKVEAS